MKRREKKMLTLKDYVEAINYRITGGSEYQWKCFGPNARYMDCESETLNEFSVVAVFDSVDQTVYTVEAWDYKSDKCYRWIHPDYIKAYKKECKKHDVDFKNASDDKDFIDLEVAEDILEKARAIVAGEEYDVRIQVPLNLDREQMFDLMKYAHEADMTLNEYVESILQKVIDEGEFSAIA